MVDGSEVLDQLQAMSIDLAALQHQMRSLTTIIEELRDDGRQPHDPLLGARDIWRYVGRGRSWFYDAKKKGIIPPPDSALGDRGGERWLRSTIDQAMAIQSNGRCGDV